MQKRRGPRTESRQHGGLQVRKMRSNQRRKRRCDHGEHGGKRECVALKLIENVFSGGGKCQMLVEGEALVYLTVSM